MSKRFPFTKREIEALSPHDPDSKSREAEYSDAECIGLKLRVSKGGRKFFQHRYRYMGRKKCMSLGEFLHATVQDARSRVSEHKSLLARDIDPSDDRAQKTNDLTFSVFVSGFYIPHAKQHKKTWQEDVYKLDGLEDGLSKAAIKLLLFTGGRRGEITSLRYDQLKLNEKRLFLPDTKNGKSRSIILNDRAIAVIKELKKNKDDSPRTEESDYLFPTKKGTKKPYIYDLRTPFGKACDAAGISGLRVHDLRHSFATLALQGGASLYDVSKLLGHSDVSMTQKYAHMADDSLQTATDNMAGVIDRAVGDKAKPTKIDVIKDFL